MGLLCVHIITKQGKTWMSKLICGVGITDVKVSEMINGKQAVFKSYKCWNNMLKRCYSEEIQSKRPTYIGCTVIDGWLTYSKFKEWYDAHHIDGWQLDKDLLIDGNKIYSAETCVFVPSQLNTLLLDHASKRGEFPIGVYFHKRDGKYRAQCNVNGKQKSIGLYNTPEQASDAYQVFKSGYVLGEINAYRNAYQDNQQLMNLLDVLEDRFKQNKETQRMNIEQLVERYGYTTRDGSDVVLVDDLIELLTTHVIVPREPSDEALIEWKKSSLGKSTRNVYSAMIKAAENE